MILIMFDYVMFDAMQSSGYIFLSGRINILCFSVCLYQIKTRIKTTELVWHTFWVGPHMTHGKVYECTELQKVVCKKLFIRKILKVYEKIIKFYFVLFKKMK